MSAYRIEEREDGFEPQMLYQGNVGTQWFPLLANGYWAEPEAYHLGITRRSILSTREVADRAILRAKAINGEHIRAAP